jgi:predicted ATPase
VLIASALAEILADSGQRAEALETIRAGIAYAAETGICLWQAEHLRMQAEMTLEDGSTTQRKIGEALLEESIEIARKQRAKSLELRAATSLAGLWMERGEPDRARTLLAPIFGSFTQGFDTVDLRAAAALLEPVSLGRSSQ